MFLLKCLVHNSLLKHF